MGLPLHPLINHAVAVLVPLSALGVILLLAFPKLVPTYSPLILISLLTSTIAGFIAENSGQALSNRVGYPEDHAEQGEWLSKVILVFAILYTIWFLLSKSLIQINKGKKLINLGLNSALLIAAIASTYLTFLVGHSGAQATWEDRIKASAGEEITETGQQNNLPTDKNGNKPLAGSINLTATEIKKHTTAKDCWSIVNGKVYNLTSYVQKHPGGASVISNICGKDGTNSFSIEHGSSSKPNNVLSSFLLGNLGAQITQKQSTTVQPVPSSGANGESENDEDEEENEDEDDKD
jgi:cytochrome b involved in lipid metabolism